MDHEAPRSLLEVTDDRDRLLVALLVADPGQVVLRWDPDVAVLLSTMEVRRILVLTVPEGVPEDRLAYAFSAHVKTVVRGAPATHFVVMGGGPEVDRALKTAAPRLQPVPMGFHHLDSHGALTHVTGQRLPILARACAAVDPAVPIDRPRIEEARARGQALVAQEQAVASKLQGRSQATMVIVAVCAVLTGLSYLWGAGAHDAVLWRMGANRGEALRHGELWRLFASAFLHANGRHLLMNMFALWSLGPFLEAILGPRRYLLLYGAAALGGSLASGFFGSDHWSVGASGAIWGLMAAAFALAIRPNGVLPPRMAQQMKGRLGVALVINVGISLIPGIDFRAHLGGGVVGFALMASVLTVGLTPLEQRATPADAEGKSGGLLSIATALMIAAMALSVVVAIVVGRPWEVGAAPVLRRTPIGDTGMTIELPSSIADEETVADGKSSPARVYTFGKLNEMPVMFELIVSEMKHAIPPGPSLDAYLEQARKNLDERGPAKAVRSGPAKRVTLAGDRRAVLVEHTINGYHLTTYLEVAGTHQVLVRGYSSEERPSTWQGLEAKVAGTLSAE